MRKLSKYSVWHIKWIPNSFPRSLKCVCRFTNNQVDFTGEIETFLYDRTYQCNNGKKYPY